MNRYELKYRTDEAKNPILAQAVLETGCLVNILLADVESSRGRMVITVIDDGCEKKIIKYLKDMGVEVKKLEGRVEKDEGSCIDCGACKGVCPTDAIEMVDDTMELDEKKCVGCGECVVVCPVRALTIPIQ